MKLSPNHIKIFRQLVWDFYTKHKRDMPWREHIDSYHVVVSEVMLQQTQVARVLEKFPQWIAQFPTFSALAQADLPTVLAAWQGMGYNRRGKYLSEIAQIVVEKYGGVLPDDPAVLQTFPGLGYATANSIVAFAYNKPVVFIETNIRRLFIHHFFRNDEEVHDRDIMVIVAETLDTDNPREWYYALMDYGSSLAKKVENPNRKSKHYSKQSKFEGSDRQIRGEILRQALEQPITYQHILDKRLGSKDKVNDILQQMEKEGFLVRDEGEKYRVKK